jgi:kynurenine formamidase
MIRFVDLSLPTENNTSEPFPPVIQYKDHEDGAKRLGKLAGIPAEDFPGGLGLATESITLTTHSGTHVDAPWHYGPTSEGKPSRTIDEIPLEWCYGPGIKLDLRHKEPGAEITPGDLQTALQQIPHELQPGDVVLLHTGADKYWGTEKYLDMQCGLSAEGTEWLLKRGIRCIGIDAWGMDRPVSKMAEAHRAGQPNALWPSHFYGRKYEYLQIEKLANLELLPARGFIVSAFPVKIKKASAGWCRAVALLEA